MSARTSEKLVLQKSHDKGLVGTTREKTILFPIPSVEEEREDVGMMSRRRIFKDRSSPFVSKMFLFHLGPCLGDSRLLFGTLSGDSGSQFSPRKPHNLSS